MSDRRKKNKKQNIERERRGKCRIMSVKMREVTVRERREGGKRCECKLRGKGRVRDIKGNRRDRE